MNILVGVDNGSYTFNKTTKQITLSNIMQGNTLLSIALEQIVIIVNVTKGIMIFNFDDALLGATISSNVITLNYDTSSMANTDRLSIIIKIPDPMEELLNLLQRAVNLLEPLGNVDSAWRQRVTVDAFGAAMTVASITTLGTITNPVPIGNVATIGGQSPAYNYMDTAQIAYQQCQAAYMTF